MRSLDAHGAAVRREVKFFNRAIVVAGLSAVSYVLASLVIEWLFSLGQSLSAMLAILISAQVSYLGHAWFTFATALYNKAQIIRFIASLLLTSLISWCVTGFVIPSFQLEYWQGLIIVSGIVPVFNYAFLRCVVFRLR